MKYDNLKAFEKHLENAAPQHFSNLYVVLAKDGFDIKIAVDLLIHHLLPEKDREISLCIFDGLNLTADDLLAEIQVFSFLSQKKVIWIQQFDKLKKNIVELLENQFLSLPRSTYLILTGSALTKTLSFYKKIEKAGVILELVELKPWEKEKKLIEWLSKKALEVRKVMSYQVCQVLVKYTGSNQTLLSNEFEKLLCLVGDRGEITLQDINAVCVSFNADTLWQLGEVIFRRDVAPALRICRNLLLEGQAFLPLLRQLRSQFQTHYQVSLILARGGTSEEIQQEFPYMKGSILERHIQLTQLYGKSKFRQGLLTIDQIEMKAKNSQITEELLADLLIFNLTG